MSTFGNCNCVQLNVVQSRWKRQDSLAKIDWINSLQSNMSLLPVGYVNLKALTLEKDVTALCEAGVVGVRQTLS